MLSVAHTGEQTRTLPTEYTQRVVTFFSSNVELIASLKRAMGPDVLYTSEYVNDVRASGSDARLLLLSIALTNVLARNVKLEDTQARVRGNVNSVARAVLGEAKGGTHAGARKYVSIAYDVLERRFPSLYALVFVDGAHARGSTAGHEIFVRIADA